jgi:hypothetical protein
MISIGAVMGGPELEGGSFDQASDEVCRAVIDLRGSFGTGESAEVNVVFHVPGSIIEPDWEGARDATFSKKRKLLMVQVAVPRDVAAHPWPIAFIIESLHKANRIALRVFHGKGIEFPLAAAEDLVDRVADRLRET